jgi:hypothetical protein
MVGAERQEIPVQTKVVERLEMAWSICAHAAEAA